jgi:hypothetical protein
MLMLTRHMLNEHLLSLPVLTDRYAAHDAGFVPESLSWLAEVEQSLLRLRLPLAGMVASARGQILATKDGYRERELLGDCASPRQAERATTTIALNRVEAALRQIIDDRDGQIRALKEKMAQLLAVASAVRPIPSPDGRPREEWLRVLWSSMPVTGETVGMYTYLNASTPHDDLYPLLGELLNDLLASASGES